MRCQWKGPDSSWRYTLAVTNLISHDHSTDGVGQLHVINGQLDIVTFQAYDNRVSMMYQLKQHNVLVTVGVSSSVFSNSV